MFLDKHEYTANIKESINIKVGEKIVQELHDVSILNIKDFRCVSELTKAAFKNPAIEDQIAAPFLLVKSFEKDISYLITWGYKDLEAVVKSSDKKILDEYAIKQKNKFLADIKTK